MVEIFFKSLFNLEGIAPEKPHRATFEAKVGEIEMSCENLKSLILRFLSTNILTLLKSTLAKKKKFSSEAFPVDSHVTEHPRPCVQLNYFKTRRINVMFNKRAAVFYLV